MSAVFDFASLMTVLLLCICLCSFIRAATLKISPETQQISSWIDGTSDIRFFFWRLSRIGDRLSPWVAAACIGMAIHLLFIRR
jgi:hypothetical protein